MANAPIALAPRARAPRAKAPTACDPTDWAPIACFLIVRLETSLFDALFTITQSIFPPSQTRTMSRSRITSSGGLRSRFVAGKRLPRPLQERINFGIECWESKTGVCREIKRSLSCHSWSTRPRAATSTFNHALSRYIPQNPAIPNHVVPTTRGPHYRAGECR